MSASPKALTRLVAVAGSLSTSQQALGSTPAPSAVTFSLAQRRLPYSPAKCLPMKVHEI